MTTKIITAPSVSGTSASIAAEGQLLKKTLLAEAAEIDMIASDEDVEKARHVAAKIKGLITDVGKIHDSEKKPFLDIGRAIDQLMKDYVKELNRDLKRLNEDIGMYIFEQAEKARKAEAERIRIINETAARVEAERVEAQRKLDEIAAKEKAGQEIKPEDKAAALDAVLTNEGKKEEVIVAFRAAPITFSRPSGGAQQMQTIVEVTDVHAIYAFRPNLVKLEAKIGEIKILIDAGITVPGVKWEKKPVFQTRGVSSNLIK